MVSSLLNSAYSMKPGTVLAGKYRVEGLIGAGGMGVVVQAVHLQLDERVALKFLLPEYAARPDASARFQREARAAAKIHSEHVARVSDVGTLENGSPYMVMEYLEGEDASKRLERGVLTIADAVDCVIQACDAIARAHALGIVHRDIKPANLFIAQHSDGSPLIKVLDFGISKTLGDAPVNQLTSTTATVGSALYMSPEQIKQSRSVDHRTDIYSLGVTLYELLSGRQPFVADSFPALCVEIATGAPLALLELRPDLPRDFVQVVERAYERDREARYQSVAELAVALAPWAPARSTNIIDRLARAAGMSVPITGQLLPVPAGVAPTMLQSSTSAAFARAASTRPKASTIPPRRSRMLALVAASGLFVLAALAIGIYVLRGIRANVQPAPAPETSAELTLPPIEPPVGAAPTPAPRAPKPEQPSAQPPASSPPTASTERSTPKSRKLPTAARKLEPEASSKATPAPTASVTSAPTAGKKVDATTYR